MPSIFVTAIISAAVPVRNNSSAIYNSVREIERSARVYPKLLAIVIAESRVIPSNAESAVNGV
jgi:hypothetical protein